MTNEPWVSIDAIARHLDVSKDTVYRWIDQRGMPAHKVGRQWKFKISEIDAWVRAGKARKAGRNHDCIALQYGIAKGHPQRAYERGGLICRMSADSKPFSAFCKG